MLECVVKTRMICVIIRAEIAHFFTLRIIDKCFTLG